MIGKRRYFSEGTVSFLKKGISNFLLQTQSEGDIFGVDMSTLLPS